MKYHDEVKEGANIIVRDCAQTKSSENVLILADEYTVDVGKHLLDAAKSITENVTFMVTKKANMHGTEPAKDIADAMLKSDIIFGATSVSMAHTEARANATKAGSRYLSLPDYSIEQLASPSLRVDFLKCAQNASKIKKILDSGRVVEVSTEKGTRLVLGIAERKANFCPGFVFRPGMIGSPPDIEANVPTIENKSNGTVVVDGSIPCKEIGLIKKDIRIEVEDGMVKRIDKGTEHGKTLEKLLSANPKNRVLAEFGIGLNPNARLCGNMLEDEGCYGTIHLGFGSNSTIGGKNKINFHLDFVIRNPTVKVDGNPLMERGVLLYDGLGIWTGRSKREN
jgi:leucyl aminopeptidase (aminopeptidase T)